MKDTRDCMQVFNPLIYCFSIRSKCLLCWGYCSSCCPSFRLQICWSLWVLLLLNVYCTYQGRGIVKANTKCNLWCFSLGCVLLVVYGVQLLWNTYNRHRQTICCFLMLILTTSSLRVIIRNKDWRSRESLLR